MRLENLPKTTTRAAKRVGRGIGSGKGGHTAGRGQKGQKTRGKIPLTFEGTKVKKSLLKRLPVLRGKGKFKPLKKKARVVVNTKYLNLFPSKSEITLESLKAARIVSPETERVKILGEGELVKALVVKLPTSAGAKEKIEKAGGKVI